MSMSDWNSEVPQPEWKPMTDPSEDKKVPRRGFLKLGASILLMLAGAKFTKDQLNKDDENKPKEVPTPPKDIVVPSNANVEEVKTPTPMGTNVPKTPTIPTPTKSTPKSER